MVPVEIVPEPEPLPRRRRMERAGFIEIEFGCGARVCIRGEVAPRTLRQIMSGARALRGYGGNARAAAKRGGSGRGVAADHRCDQRRGITGQKGVAVALNERS